MINRKRIKGKLNVCLHNKNYNGKLLCLLSVKSLNDWGKSVSLFVVRFEICGIFQEYVNISVCI